MPYASAALLEVTIANNASLSDAAHIGSADLLGIMLPAWDNAGMTFQASVDGSTFAEALDSGGSAITIATGTGDRWWQAPATLKGIPYLKVRSGTSGAPVNQSPAVTITLVVG